MTRSKLIRLLISMLTDALIILFVYVVGYLAQDSKIELKNSNENSVVSFTANEDFKTLIISSSKLTSGTYYVYINGTKSSYNKTVK